MTETLAEMGQRSISLFDKPRSIADGWRRSLAQLPVLWVNSMAEEVTLALPETKYRQIVPPTTDTAGRARKPPSIVVPVISSEALAMSSKSA